MKEEVGVLNMDCMVCMISEYRNSVVQARPEASNIYADRRIVKGVVNIQRHDHARATSNTLVMMLLGSLGG